MMFSYLRVLTAAFLLVLFVPRLSAQDKFTVFGGYSYLRPPVTAEETFLCPPEPTNGVCPLFSVAPTFVTNRQNLNGWELTGTYRIFSFLELAADFSGHYGSALSNSSSNAHEQTFIFGPQFSFPGHISPFAHFLFGATHQSISSGTLSNATPPYNEVTPFSGTGFAQAVGGGLDLKLIPHVWIRPIQVDLLSTWLHNTSQTQIRVSAGVVLHF